MITTGYTDFSEPLSDWDHKPMKPNVLRFAFSENGECKWQFDGEVSDLRKFVDELDRVRSKTDDSK